MVDVQVLPIYAIIDYAWAMLKKNTTMKESDYNNRIAIIPTSQQPEFTALNKPFIVYTWSELPTNDISAMRSGVAAFAVYGTTDREINKISNLLVNTFNRWDMSAEGINTWARSGPFAGIRFDTLWATGFDGPSPESQEGGRQSSVVVIRYNCTVDYTVDLP